MAYVYFPIVVQMRTVVYRTAAFIEHFKPCPHGFPVFFKKREFAPKDLVSDDVPP